MPRHTIELPPNCRQLLVRPWVDPLVDQVGHDPRSPYVERFWLGVLGPSVTWFVRYVAERFDGTPDGFDLDLATCAAALGLGTFQGRAAAFPRTLTRCCQFRAARLVNGVTFEVRRKLPPLNASQLARLPDALRLEHRRWVATTSTGDRSHPVALGDQARRLALSLVELGEGPGRVEEQLCSWRFPAAMAREATIWAFERRGASLITKP
ncbi:MAG: hypothetical protein ACRD2C_19295 [Acidimicrobiales bacterium]